MDVGVPRETKDQEYRVGLSPTSVRSLTDRGHTVFIEKGAGRRIWLCGRGVPPNGRTACVTRSRSLGL